jgi:hypothetical protein
MLTHSEIGKLMAADRKACRGKTSNRSELAFDDERAKLNRLLSDTVPPGDLDRQ